jgi:hypothetical protein
MRRPSTLIDNKKVRYLHLLQKNMKCCKIECVIPDNDIGVVRFEIGEYPGLKSFKGYIINTVSLQPIIAQWDNYVNYKFLIKAY